MTLFPTLAQLERAKYRVVLWDYPDAPQEFRVLFERTGEIIVYFRNTNGMAIDMSSPDIRYWFTLYPDFEERRLDEHTRVFLLKSIV